MPNVLDVYAPVPYLFTEHFKQSGFVLKILKREAILKGVNAEMLFKVTTSAGLYNSKSLKEGKGFLS